ncbi:hypothetical protein JCM33374_g1527 [Metschnikowia sp. JCM 33374]|nr:hypothetical protein JCM33374_g1527 [Metschnikowia sp. JCM 33374]
MTRSSAEMDDINTLLRHIDTVQSQVFSEIKLISTNGSSGPDDVPQHFSRDATVKRANTLIQKIPDLVRVVELKTSQLPSHVAADNFLHETIELYHGKVKQLRRKLKDAQLAAYNEENALIHKQRLREYCPPKNDCHNSDSSDSGDARRSLFSGRSASEKSPHDKTKSIGDQILTQNKNITTSLQHSKQLMTMSVMQTELNIDTLDQQSKDLSQLNEKLIDMETVLTKSRQIVKFIEKQDKHDKRRIYAAIAFLLLCSAWVLWRRVLKMPVRILLWTLLKMFGVVNWVASVSPRNAVTEPSIEPSADILAQSSPFFVSTSSYIKTDTLLHKQVESIAPEVSSVYPSSDISMDSSLEGLSSVIEAFSTTSLEETYHYNYIRNDRVHRNFCPRYRQRPVDLDMGGISTHVDTARTFFDPYYGEYKASYSGDHGDPNPELDTVDSGLASKEDQIGETPGSEPPFEIEQHKQPDPALESKVGDESMNNAEKDVENENSNSEDAVDENPEESVHEYRHPESYIEVVSPAPKEVVSPAPKEVVSPAPKQVEVPEKGEEENLYTQEAETGEEEVFQEAETRDEEVFQEALPQHDEL